MQQLAINGTEEMEDGDQYLVFQVEDEAFGVPILTVQEIIGYRDVTPIPNTPPFLRGVLNLRGVVVPVVDLRRQFGMETKEYNRFNVIVIVHACDKILGVIVDMVKDVHHVAAKEVQPRPEFASRINTEFISGVVSNEDSMMILLDLDRIFTDAQIGILDRATQRKDAE